MCVWIEKCSVTRVAKQVSQYVVLMKQVLGAPAQFDALLHSFSSPGPSRIMSCECTRCALCLSDCVSVYALLNIPLTLCPDPIIELDKKPCFDPDLASVAPAPHYHHPDCVVHHSHSTPFVCHR